MTVLDFGQPARTFGATMEVFFALSAKTSIRMLQRDKSNMVLTKVKEVISIRK
jgi:hypothetical protein